MTNSRYTSAAVRGRDAGGHAKDGSGVEQVPPWGGEADQWEPI